MIAGGAVRDVLCGREINDIDIFIQHFHDVDDNGTSFQTNWDGMMGGDDTNTWLNRVFTEDPNWECSCLYRTYERWQHRNVSPSNIAYGAAASPHIISIDTGCFHDMNFQFIFVNKHPLEFVQKYFDINLCRAWFDGTKVSVSSPFLQDWTNKTITLAGDLTRGEYEYARAEHLPRVRRKYPNFTVVVDPELRARFSY